MRCPKCTDPMTLARRDRRFKTFRCGRCSERIDRREAAATGYNGSLVMASWVPVRLQETAGALLVLLALASGSPAATLTTATGTMGTMTADATATTNDVQVDGAGALIIYTDATSVAGTNTGVVCQQTGEPAATASPGWTTITAAFPNYVPTFAAKGTVCVVAFPVGRYRVTNTTCNTTCSLVVRWKAVNLK